MEEPAKEPREAFLTELRALYLKYRIAIGGPEGVYIVPFDEPRHFAEDEDDDDDQDKADRAVDWLGDYEQRP